MSCIDVRDRLAEYSLGVLLPRETAEIERHLERCPGCRKEAGELQEGLTPLAMGVPRAEPSVSLERKVVDRVQAAAGRRSHVGHRSMRVLVVATLSAFLLALGAVAWGVAQRHEAQFTRTALVTKVRNLERVFRGAGSYQAALAPPGNSRDEGRALIYSSPKAQDLILVDVFLTEPDPGPYTFRLLDRVGHAISGGQLQKSRTGEWIFFEESGRDLSKGRTLAVSGAKGRVILSGVVRSAAR